MKVDTFFKPKKIVIRKSKLIVLRKQICRKIIFEYKSTLIKYPYNDIVNFLTILEIDPNRKEHYKFYINYLFRKIDKYRGYYSTTIPIDDFFKGIIKDILFKKYFIQNFDETVLSDWIYFAEIIYENVFKIQKHDSIFIYKLEYNELEFI